MNSKHMLWVSYIMSTLPVLMLLFSGIMKLIKPPSVMEGFAHLGYDESVALGLGVVELLATPATWAGRRRLICVSASHSTWPFCSGCLCGADCISGMSDCACSSRSGHHSASP